MIHARMVELFSVCGHDVRVEMLAAACNLSKPAALLAAAYTLACVEWKQTFTEFGLI
jgi:hypothetical protein